MFFRKVSTDISYILIVASSARMLANAAQKYGYIPLVIDTYADEDISNYAEKILYIESLKQNILSSAVDIICHHYPVKHVVYGAGFEDYPDSLQYLANRFHIVGNNVEIFRKIQNKSLFFEMLHNLSITHPEVTFSVPRDNAEWLFKPFNNLGGNGIVRFAPENPPKQFGYWQKFQSGAPHSVLFLADGNQSQIIGFNQQWTIKLNTCDEFIFAGLINSTNLTDIQKHKLTIWVNQLVKKFELVGLNSLDFIQEGDGLYVLEINPRSPASMQLYDADLFHAHVKACQGELIGLGYQQKQITGLQIVYALDACRIPDNMIWPEGAQDLPHAGTQINTAQPICSIMAHGATAEMVRQRLNQKQQFIVNQLEGLDSWNTAPALIN